MPEAEKKTSTYTVTERAGNFVAGRRSPGKGKPIDLTDAQAETPLRNGEIAKEGESAKPDTKSKSGKAGNAGKGFEGSSK